MKQPRPMKASEGSWKATTSTPQFADIVFEYRKLNTREARVAFVHTFLRSWAYNFEKSWPVIYQALEWVEQEKLYQDERVVGAFGETQSYPDFKSYFEATLKRPFETWFELERTHHFVEKYAPDLIDKTWTQARAEAAQRAQEIDAADRANLRPRGRPKKNFDNNKTDIQDLAPTGTSRAAALRRLRKDRPDIHIRVLAGELSPHAGMVEAGFRKKLARKKLTRIDRAKKLVQAMTKIELRQFRKWIDESF